MEEFIDVDKCKLCSELKSNRSQIVNGDGNTSAKILFVGEAPGEEEDEKGKPFIGKSGKVLRNAIEDFVDVNYRITNCVRCRPPENRDPKTEEISNCKKHLTKEILVIDPDIIVCLGKIPCKSILGEKVSTIKEAGEVRKTTIQKTVFKAIICPHPAATLYNNDYKDTFRNVIKLSNKKASKGGQKNLSEFF